MKTLRFLLLLPALVFMAGTCERDQDMDPDPNDFSCDAIQEQLDLSGFCGLDINAHFNLLSPTDMTCSFSLSADAITSGAWPHSDFINI
ncbi:MAG: hypothetical protein KDC44_14080, partial [Phaeodactylibacter sp.]|nr:hypothetical protein [Phaeodactylibacter sp.]